MACRNSEHVIGVTAPNGEPSLLYASLLQAHKGDQKKSLKAYLVTETEEFKKWFGDSKVVDKNGEPLILWHGANQIGPQNGEQKFKDNVLFATDSYDYARGGNASESHMTPVFMRASNILDTDNRFIKGSMMENIEELGTEHHPDYVNPLFTRSLGHWDGMKGKDFGENGSNSYVTFDRRDMKSVFNSGLFSDSDNLFDNLDETEELAAEILGEETSEHVADSRMNELQDLIEKQRLALERRLRTLEESLSKEKGLSKLDRINRGNSLEELSQLISKLRDLDTKTAFVELIKYSKREIGKLNEFLEDKFDPANSIHDVMLIQIRNQMEAFGGLRVPEFAKKNTKLITAINEINSLYNQINMTLPEKLESFMHAMIKAESGDSLTDEDITKYLKEGEDIDYLSSQFIDTGSSTDKILAVVDKIRKRKMEQIAEANRDFKSKVMAEGRKLIAAGVEGFDWMLVKDSAGKFTGKFVERIGSKYKDAVKALKATVKDVDGQPIQYIKKKAHEMSAAEKKHNLELSEKKKHLSDFLRPEKDEVDQYGNKTGKVTDGNNRRYSQEFKDQRKKFEYRVKTDEGWYEWKMRPGVDAEAYDKYLKTFYTPEKEIWVMVKEENEDGEWEPTGEVEPKMMRFVRSEYVEVTEKWNEAAYDSIMGDNSAAGKAKRDFFEFYSKEFNNLMDRIPIDVARSMQGNVFRIRNEVARKASGNGLGFFRSFIKTVKETVKSLVTPDIITSGRRLDENGHAEKDLGLFYVGDLYDQAKIDKYKQRLEDLRGTTIAEEIAEVKKLMKAIKIEEGKAKVEDIEVDLVHSLIHGGQMVEHYDQMKSIESTMLIAQEVLRNKKYIKMDSKGHPILDPNGNPEYKHGSDVRVVKRMEAYLRMVYYKNSETNNNAIGQIALKFKDYVSMRFQGLNPFSGINNVVTAEMNQKIEARGRQFYTDEQYSRAGSIMIDHLKKDAWLSDRIKAHDKYEDRRPSNKFDAIVEYFNFLQQGTEKSNALKGTRSAAEYAKSMDWLFIQIELGEYQAQTRSAIAKMLNTKVTLQDGTETNVWDAYEFDEATRELKLPAGADFSKNDKYKLTNEIKSMSKFIHGNYDPEDKVPIQEHWLGELAFQFKKWMPNSIRNRFGGQYYDEGLGMEVEGRYRVIKRFLEGLQVFGLDKYKDVYNSMTELEKQNMQKNIAELQYFATALALYMLFHLLAGQVPPDDEYLLACVNFLKKQSDRTRGEITFWSPTQIYSSVKNPIAGLRVIEQVGSFVGTLAGIPFNYATGQGEDNFYDRGVNKGELKLYKKTKDLFPILGLGSQFEQLYVSGNFFIK